MPSGHQEPGLIICRLSGLKRGLRPDEFSGELAKKQDDVLIATSLSVSQPVDMWLTGLPGRGCNTLIHPSPTASSSVSSDWTTALIAEPSEG